MRARVLVTQAHASFRNPEEAKKGTGTTAAFSASVEISGPRNDVLGRCQDFGNHD
jgi:hypothetical protein